MSARVDRMEITESKKKCESRGEGGRIFFSLRILEFFHGCKSFRIFNKEWV